MALKVKNQTDTVQYIYIYIAIAAVRFYYLESFIQRIDFSIVVHAVFFLMFFGISSSDLYYQEEGIESTKIRAKLWEWETV